MNEPMIVLDESEDGRPVRRFVHGNAPNGGGAARREGRGTGFLGQDLAQRAWSRTIEIGYAAFALTKAGLKLARRR